MLKIVNVETVATGAPRHRGFPALSYDSDHDQLVLAFREGSDHVESRDGCVVLMRRIGEKWSHVKTFSPRDDEDLRVNHGMMYPYLPIQIVTNTHRVEIELHDLRTNSFRRIPAGMSYPATVFPYGRITKLGAMMIPGYEPESPYNNACSVLVSAKSGKTLLLAMRKRFDFTEADITTYEGRFIAVVREEKGVAFTTQSDRGDWTPLKPLNFEAHSPCLLEHQGILLLAYRGLEHCTNKFGEDVVKVFGTCVRWSKDGREWSEPLVIEPSHFWDCGYPSMVSVGEDVFCAYYSEFAHGNSDIKLATLRWEP